MFRSALRAASRRPQPPHSRSASPRFLSTAPAPRRTWRGAAVRWGLAGAAVYYYNTSALFAEEPDTAIAKLDGSIHRVQETQLPTVDAVVAEKRVREADVRRQARRAEEARAQAPSVADSEAAAQQQEPASASASAAASPSASGAVEDLESEADQQGAFNPETGEINWDCPCLGGMAHGPCGEEFKAAFSCFVYSKEEPKGMECIDKFKGMQDCFRAHPETYGAELEDDEDYDEGVEMDEELSPRDQEALASAVPGMEVGAKVTEVPPEKDASSRARDSSRSAIPAAAPSKAVRDESQKATANATSNVSSHDDFADARQTTASAETQKSGDEGGDLIPRDMHDATGSSKNQFKNQ